MTEARIAEIAPIQEFKQIAETLHAWFEANARDLPWRQVDSRLGRRDAYRSLVSELMLQQTQVSRVLEKFDQFIERFPTVEALAQADEHDVLAAWSGLGYYRRARLLYSAAKDIVARHNGVVPTEPSELLEITGIGRYTAGAIASIVFDLPAPIVDGNVSRVLMRLRGDARSAADREATKQNWADAESLARSAFSPAKTNEGLMELGALVCTPKAPRCESCPLRPHCRAADLKIQSQIPAAKPAATRSTVYHTSVVLKTVDGRLLVERRPPKGLWASMWQAPSNESPTSSPRPSAILKRLGLTGKCRKTEEFTHITSHREVRFRIYSLHHRLTAREAGSLSKREGIALISPAELGDYAIANPHRRVLEGRPSTG